MPYKKNNILYLILPTLVLICTGCTVERPIESLFPPDDPAKTVAKAGMPGRFQNQTVVEPSNSAVQSAMEPSRKSLR